MQQTFNLSRSVGYPIKEALNLSRSVGYPLKFNNTSLGGLLSNKQKLLSSIDQNGCVCLKNVNLSPKEQVEFTKKIWGDVVQLPKFLAFNNQDQTYKQIARVGNMQFDGTLKDSSKQAIYWHQDGDFWGVNKKHIFNCLHTKVIPTTGGDTVVMDLVKAAQFIKNKKPELYKRMKNLVGELNLDEIPDFKAHGVQNVMGIQRITMHDIIKPFNRYGYDQVLLLSVFTLLDKESKKLVPNLTITQIHNILQSQMGIYSHKWQEGDMLIWDNLQVMHKASGSFTGNRLLHRTQGNLHP